jgi:hypothetical protein
MEDKSSEEAKSLAFKAFREFVLHRFSPYHYSEDIFEFLRSQFAISDSPKHTSAAYYTTHFASDEKIIRWLRRVMNYCSLAQPRAACKKPKYQLTSEEQFIYDFFQEEHEGGVYGSAQKIRANHYIFWHSKRVLEDKNTEVSKVITLLNEMTLTEMEIVAEEAPHELKLMFTGFKVGRGV